MASGPDQHHEDGARYPITNRERQISTIIEESIAQDLEDEGVPEAVHDEDYGSALSRTSTNDPAWTQHSLAGSYRRPSYVSSGPRPFLGLGAQPPEHIIPSEQEREEAIDEERSLLRDNNLIPSRHPRRRDSQTSNKSATRSLKQRIPNSGFSLSRHKSPIPDEESTTSHPTETTALLPPNDPSEDPPDDPESITKTWEDAVLTGSIQTTWQREAQTCWNYAWPLMITYILQNSLTLTSVFTVGHIGKNELGAISLGAMTANITGYAVYHGLSTSLDTLCAQAYGSGRKKLVGLNLQRMVLFLWTITIPIGVVWFFGTEILKRIVPEEEIAVLAGRYLKVMIVGAPGYAAFESGKRYVQAQGQFTATLYVLLIAAPLNVLLHWLFVWVWSSSSFYLPLQVLLTIFRCISGSIGVSSAVPSRS
jgi:MATE family multidrug resistance protein